MNRSQSPFVSKSSRALDFIDSGHFIEAHKDSDNRERRRPISPVAILIIGLLGVLCIGLFGFALFQSKYKPSAADPVSCQKLIDKAITFTKNDCNQIGANKACYGNITLKAQMVPNASQRFSERGDVVDVSQIESLSAAPLNPTTDEWGIAIFRVVANLPGSVPGEVATLMVFGNTKLNNLSNGLDSFYFSSELGQIVCDKVPFDGILINLPKGTGWTFDVNGTKLTLMGDASLKANTNGNMEVALYNGAGQIISNGLTQDFGAGQKVTVNLGGPHGDQAIGPPSQPEPLSLKDQQVICTMTGNYCNPGGIPTVDAAQAQAIVQSGLLPVSSNIASPLPPLILQTPAIIPTGNITPPTVALNTSHPGNGSGEAPKDVLPPEVTPVPTNGSQPTVQPPAPKPTDQSPAPKPPVQPPPPKPPVQPPPPKPPVQPPPHNPHNPHKPHKPHKPPEPDKPPKLPKH